MSVLPRWFFPSVYFWESSWGLGILVCSFFRTPDWEQNKGPKWVLWLSYNFVADSRCICILVSLFLDLRKLIDHTTILPYQSIESLFRHLNFHNLYQIILQTRLLEYINILSHFGTISILHIMIHSGVICGTVKSMLTTLCFTFFVNFFLTSTI